MTTIAAGAGPVRTLAPCPDSSNCVSSQAADTGHFIEPLRFDGSPQEAMGRLRRVLRSLDRMEIVEDSGDHLRAEATSRVFRFVDDVEFVMLPDEGVIHVRSASRVGYGDFGANRRRVEEIRRRFTGSPDEG